MRHRLSNGHARRGLGRPQRVRLTRTRWFAAWAAPAFLVKNHADEVFFIRRRPLIAHIKRWESPRHPLRRSRMKRAMNLPVERLRCVTRSTNHDAMLLTRRPYNHTLGSMIGVLLVAAALSTVSTVARSTQRDFMGVCIPGAKCHERNEPHSNFVGSQPLYRPHPKRKTRLRSYARPMPRLTISRLLTPTWTCSRAFGMPVHLSSRPPRSRSCNQSVSPRGQPEPGDVILMRHWDGTRRSASKHEMDAHVKLSRRIARPTYRDPTFLARGPHAPAGRSMLNARSQ